jgi:hypothetical protein
MMTMMTAETVVNQGPKCPKRDELSWECHESKLDAPIVFGRSAIRRETAQKGQKAQPLRQLFLQ